MTLESRQEVAEVVEADIALVIDKKPALRLTLTNRAAYWNETQRIPLADIINVTIGRRSILGSLAAGILMITIGVVWTLAPVAEGKIFVGAPQALMLGGVLTAIFGSRRRTMSIETKTGNFYFSEPVAFGGGVAKRVDAALDDVRRWVQKHQRWS